MRTDENAVEGARVGFERRLRELARGLLPVFDTLDLHGMNAEKAEAAVRSFCASARGQVPRTVLVVHGKGLHSPAGKPVLRDAVPTAYGAGGARVRFVTARPNDGGGAMYVWRRARPARASASAAAASGESARAHHRRGPPMGKFVYVQHFEGWLP
jgi:DNA-nicking Smr family endonuclease